MTVDRNGRSHKGRGAAGAGRFDTMAGRRAPDLDWDDDALMIDEMEDAAHAYTERVGRLGDDGLRIIIRDGLEVELHLDDGTHVSGYIFTDRTEDEDDLYREAPPRIEYYDDDEYYDDYGRDDDGIIHEWDLTDYPDMDDFYRDVFGEAGEWPEDGRVTSWERERVKDQRHDDRQEDQTDGPRYTKPWEPPAPLIDRLRAADARDPGFRRIPTDAS